MSGHEATSEEVLKGSCCFCGMNFTEGGWWAFQDARYPQDWKGVHFLQGGDHITIYAKEDPRRIVWEGVIHESGVDKWAHADACGIARETWARWFDEEYPAALIPAK